jgi:allantoate deiminase
LRTKAASIASRRGLRLAWRLVQETPAGQCDKQLTEILSRSVRQRGFNPVKLPSGAGHDAAALSRLCPVAMLFVRCKSGISHHPAESVKLADVDQGIGVLVDFIRTLGARHA